MCDSLEQRRQRFIEQARKCHGDRYDYSKVIFTDDKYLKVKIICPEHGPFEQYYMTHLRLRDSGSGYMGCRKCGTESRPRKQLCVDCGCWDKYGGSNRVCKDCAAKRKELRSLKVAMKYLCRQCGKPTGSRDKIYCSAECRVAKNRILVKCAYCKAEIVKPACQVRRSKRLFCNPECQRLSMVGGGDPQYASKKAKHAWKRRSSAERRLSSEKYKWWRLCNKTIPRHEKQDPWKKRAAAACASLRNRPNCVNRCQIKKISGSWDESFTNEVEKLRSRVRWVSLSPWSKKCNNTLSNMSKRRRKKNERQSHKEESERQAIIETHRETRVQMCFEWY